MRNRAIFAGLFCMFFGSFGYAAPSTPDAMSDSQLRKVAEEELAMPDTVVISPSTEHGTVETSSYVLSDGAGGVRSSFELEFGVQRYHAEGRGSVVGSETYALDQLGSSPMALIAFQKWFSQKGEGESNYFRPGLRLAAGYSSISMKIVTTSGTEFRDVSLRSIPVSLAPVIDYVIPNLPKLSVGVLAGVGELFTVQSGPSTVTNNSSNIPFFEAGAYTRVSIADRALVRLAYLHRSVAKGETDLGIQQDNFSFTLGVSL